MVRFLNINRLAYLNLIRNVRRGLISRTEILELLDVMEWTTTSQIADHVKVTGHTVLYHLRNLEREKVVERDTEGKGWRLGPFRQVELMEFLSPPKGKKKRQT